MRRLLGILLLLACAAPTAQADYEVRGRFLYKDREFNLSGFTGVEPNVPIRFADVEVADANTNQVLASGATDATGNFVLQVVDNQTRNLTARVKSSSNNTSSLHLTVRQTTNAAIFALAHSTFTSHAPTQNIDFTTDPAIAVQDAGGEAFNIFDVALDGMDFVASLNGSRPGAAQSLTLYWAAGTMNGTYYNDSGRAIYLLGVQTVDPDSDGYDDSVILHEFGHYVEFTLADSDNNGGPHEPNACLNLQLVWSEGTSTFLQNLVRDWKGLTRPDIYVDTTGLAGTGQRRLWYTVESPSFGIPGSGNEITVNAVLWDHYDRTATPDASPGLDDDPMQIADGRTRFWDVFTQYLPLPTVSSISIEDYWDGWFARGHGSSTEMRTIFTGRGMEFYADLFEDDSSVQKARQGGITNGSTRHTLHGVGDFDWTHFDGVLGGTYRFETQNQPCGSATRLELFAANGTTLLASSSPSDPSSFLQWTATQNGALYLRARRAPGVDQYGNYELVVDIVTAVAVSDVGIAATAAGVRLSWRAEREPTFSHFDVERSLHVDGPWERRNEAPILGAGALFEFVDAALEPGETLFYRLVGVEQDGSRSVHGPYEASGAAPARFVLHTPRPNPFNPRTELRFDLPHPGRVALRVYDLRGRLVRTLLGGTQLAAGSRVLVWDGRDDAGIQAASGIYLVHLDGESARLTQRAVLVR